MPYGATMAIHQPMLLPTSKSTSARNRACRRRHAEYRQSRLTVRTASFSRTFRQVVLSHQHAPAAIDVERAQMAVLRSDVLYHRRLAGLRVDLVDDDAVFTALVDAAAVETTACPERARHLGC